MCYESFLWNRTFDSLSAPASSMFKLQTRDVSDMSLWSFWGTSFSWHLEKPKCWKVISVLKQHIVSSYL